MKILSAQQIKAADAYTIANEPISSIDLMERAASACAQWISAHFSSSETVHIFCGKGNNGGDGLAIARLLWEQDYKVQVYIVEVSLHATDDFTANLEKLPIQPQYIHASHEVPSITTGIVVDAILGTGLNRPVEGWLAGVFHHINNLQQQIPILSIDVPSGMMIDSSSEKSTCIHARYTLSFEVYKLGFLLPENAERVGEIVLLPIGLHPEFLQRESTPYHIVDAAMVRALYQPRKSFAHKGTYGHALLIAGSYGKIGAAVLSAKACLRSGVGLLTTYLPSCGYNIMQTSVPEAMCITDPRNELSMQFYTLVQEKQQYNTIGIGPGLGTDVSTAKGLEKLLLQYKQAMVIDADALNIISQYPRLLDQIPANSILTPHPKEFERLFGATSNQFERLSLLREKAVQYKLYILLKGKFSAIACPDGVVYFNSTGNPGMATGGSGDVLTGILTGLLAQGYQSKVAVLLGAYIHGAAGDAAAEQLSQEAMVAGDIIDFLGEIFKKLPN
ncbi:NAD(P)H-hydrate epimerase [Chitinophaga skermanii]|uniref:Bifunctional NAD(P)H-hydrate repair enzyme n=1 Tax=Chitinophaga skermanii TaxID=331697 RepID=A0A327QAY1_9BACT|nr:NAD(P)H-hydrate dehydratase [Chitinophaga skermanii]RAJ00363.1 NAD(P)H-hydrate epimerase [Chitinophaga skermanii]